MGGRGANIRNEKKDEVEYTPYKHGQITRREAGIIYKAAKEGKIKVRPETTRELYGATDDYIRFATQRYHQDYVYYDRIYAATRDVLNGRMRQAQKTITEWENDNIRRATKKSVWFKYKK